jgi:hypothetical protein
MEDNILVLQPNRTPILTLKLSSKSTKDIYLLYLEVGISLEVSLSDPAAKRYDLGK